MTCFRTEKLSGLATMTRELVFSSWVIFTPSAKAAVTLVEDLELSSLLLLRLFRSRLLGFRSRGSRRVRLLLEELEASSERLART